MRSSSRFLYTLLALVLPACSFGEAPPSPQTPVQPGLAAERSCAAPVDGRQPSLAELSACEEARGHLVEALRYATRDLGEQIRAWNPETMRRARTRVQALLPRIPRVDLELADSVSDPQLTVDGHAVSADDVAGKPLLLDPGEHAIEANGRDHGRMVRASHRLVLAESDRARVHLRFE